MFRFAALLVCMTAYISAPLAQAQVKPSASKPLALSIYGMGSVALPELQHGSAVCGSGGFTVEHSSHLQLDVRGALTWRLAPLHTAIVETGPRFSTSYRHFVPYAGVLAGLAHSEYLVPAGSTLPGRGYGPVWTVAGGLDLPLGYALGHASDRALDHGFAWRIADCSYNHIYAGTGATPVIVSTGAVYHF